MSRSPDAADGITLVLNINSVWSKCLTGSDQDTCYDGVVCDKAIRSFILAVNSF